MAETNGRIVNRLARRQLVALVLATAALLLVTATALAVTGDISQPAGPAGCISQTGAGSCADGHGMPFPAFPNSVAVSPDGKSVYVASREVCCLNPDDSGVLRFNRNPTTGAISQPAGAAGCITERGADGCADGRALAGATDVVVSPDGKSVYVASIQSGAVARLNRNTTTGAISQPAGEGGCISVPDVSPPTEPCADGHALSAPTDLAVSPDGKSVYVVDSIFVVVRINRNPANGAISQPPGPAGCIRDGGGGGCAAGHALDLPFGVTVSPDGKNVYVASWGDNGALVRLNRNTTTGAIAQPSGTAGCVSEEGEGPCVNGRALDGAWSVVVSPNGKNVYVASLNSDAVTLFNRNTTSGAIAQPTGISACVSESGAGGCHDGQGLNGAQGISIAPGGKNLYVGSQNSLAVARIDRRPDGRISQPSDASACISAPGSASPMEPCATGHGFFEEGNFWTTAVAPGGRSVYATTGRAVTRLNRAP